MISVTQLRGGMYRKKGGRKVCSQYFMQCVLSILCLFTFFLYDLNNARIINIFWHVLLLVMYLDWYGD